MGQDPQEHCQDRREGDLSGTVALLCGTVTELPHKGIVKIAVRFSHTFYVAQSPNCPTKIKAGIIGALGYLISPLDLIPDMLPGIGFADDAIAIATAVALAQIYITDEIRAQAKAKLADLLGEDVLKKLDE